MLSAWYCIPEAVKARAEGSRTEHELGRGAKGVCEFLIKGYHLPAMWSTRDLSVYFPRLKEGEAPQLPRWTDGMWGPDGGGSAQRRDGLLDPEPSGFATEMEVEASGPRQTAHGERTPDGPWGPSVPLGEPATSPASKTSTGPTQSTGEARDGRLEETGLNKLTTWVGRGPLIGKRTIRYRGPAP